MKKNETKKIIRFNQDAEFYYKIGMKYGTKKIYDTALRYFRKACEMEPFNADYQFNLACILAELREIKESNSILINVLKNIDPTLTDCYFGLGCNYFDLGDTRKAREYFEKYVRYDPEGQFADETGDILYYLSIYDGSKKSGRHDSMIRKLMKEARQLTDDGQYEKACEKLEKVVETEPQFITARSLLSTAYLLSGNAEKAVIFASSALKLDPADIDAHYNLTLGYAQLGDTCEYKAELIMLTALEPEKHDDFMRLIDLCSRLGEHSTIVDLLLERLKKIDSGIYYHLLAVAYHNLGKYDKAFDAWNSDAHSSLHFKLLFDYYAQISRQHAEGAGYSTPMAYETQLPFEAEAALREKLHNYISLGVDMFAKSLEMDEELRDIVGYFLYEGYEGYEGAQKEWETLVERVLHSGDSEFNLLLDNLSHCQTVRSETRKALRRILGREPEPVKEERPETLKGRKRIEDLKSEWEDVLDCALQNKERSYKDSYRLELRAIWMNFITRQRPEKLPVIRKREVWAAALEYIYCSRNLISVSKSKLARKYNVSPSSISSILKNMDG